MRCFLRNHTKPYAINLTHRRNSRRSIIGATAFQQRNWPIDGQNFPKLNEISVVEAAIAQRRNLRQMDCFLLRFNCISISRVWNVFFRKFYPFQTSAQRRSFSCWWNPVHLSVNWSSPTVDRCECPRYSSAANLHEFQSHFPHQSPYKSTAVQKKNGNWLTYRKGGLSKISDSNFSLCVHYKIGLRSDSSFERLYLNQVESIKVRNMCGKTSKISLK